MKTGYTIIPGRGAEIDAILDALGDYWHQNPALRLGQVIGNFTPGAYEGDPYMVPDEFWLTRLLEGNTE